MNSEETLDSILENTTSIIPSYEILTKGNWLAEIPIIQNNRSAPGIRNISLEGQTDHGRATRFIAAHLLILVTVALKSSFKALFTSPISIPTFKAIIIL